MVGLLVSSSPRIVRSLCGLGHLTGHPKSPPRLPREVSFSHSHERSVPNLEEFRFFHTESSHAADQPYNSLSSRSLTPSAGQAAVLPRQRHPAV